MDQNENDPTTRRGALRVFASAAALTFTSRLMPPAHAAEDEIAKRFAFLSANGNSNCSQAFLDYIPLMPKTARLQGSCCGPMALHRYREQVEGLKAFAGIAEIAPDPYDVEAGLAQRLLVAYELELTPDQQRVYDAAMKKSAEGGPCCCRCWRWHVFGGAGKLLIRERGFDAEQVARIWDLADGCGGDSHVH